MLKIREKQMQVFEEEAGKKFEEEMVLHSKAFTPRLCEVIGDEQLRIALRQTIKRATEYNFTKRGPIRLFIELMFLLGNGFDTDPQYPIIAKVLNASDNEMLRAEKIYLELTHYLQDIAGEDAVNVFSALEFLAEFARQPMHFSQQGFANEILREMTQAFPEKVAYVGTEGMNALILEAQREARKYQFADVRGEALLVILKFAFGHDCTSDPQYPWISNTLNDHRIVNPAARAKRLEKKALTWLEHVLALPREGVPA